MKIGRFAAIVAFLLFMSVFALSVSASTSVPWYAEKFEKLGFYVFDPPFAFQDFKVTSLAGASVTRASSNGNVVLLNFWATWCPPCKTEIPSIQALSDTLKGKNFQVFAVNLGEPASTVKSFLAKEKISFPVYLDPKNTLARTYASQGIPTTYVLDKQGKFIAGMVGSYDYASPEFINLMTELAAK